MPLLFTYLLKLSISLAIVYLFYQLVLRKLTFYNWNRLYLLLYTALAFFIPFINLSPVLDRQEWSQSTIIQWVPVIGKYKDDGAQHGVTNDTFPGAWQIISLILIAGMSVMLVRLVIQFLSVQRIMRRSVRIQIEGMHIYEVKDNIIPFSFGNSIFINTNLHGEHELKEIIRHEFIHVKQRHSIDIIWGEIICLLNWYNPFAWMIKKSIRQNLEFIADHQVLENGIDKKEYQYLLLRVIGNSQFSIANQFNFSSLKKRIAMMNKTKSARVHLTRFLFIMPLFFVILVAFRNRQQQKQEPVGKELPGNHAKSYAPMDTIPKVRALNAKGYFIDIEDLDGNCEVVIRDKSRKLVKRLLLTDWNADKKSNEELFGEIPTPPLAPKHAWSLPGDDESPALKAFMKANPTVKSIGWVFTKRDGNDAVRFVNIHKTDGSIELYDLDKKDDLLSVKSKYGELPLPPDLPSPPPPPVAPGEMNVPAPPSPPIPAQHSTNLAPPAFDLTAPASDVVVPNAPTPPSPPIAGAYHVYADTIVWSNDDKTIIHGNSANTNSSIVVTTSVLEISKTESLVIVDGKVHESGTMIRHSKDGSFRITLLDKKAATKKYGEKGSQGAVEIVSLTRN